MIRDFVYEPAVLEGLSLHGLSPLPRTSPEFLRAAVSDLYRYEIRALRTALLAGRVQKAEYVDHVLGLRKKVLAALGAAPALDRAGAAPGLQPGC